MSSLHGDMRPVLSRRAISTLTENRRTGMKEPFDEKLDFLRRRGAHEIAHSEHTLLDHLCGVRALLLHWGADADIADAGLFHSVYGTEVFRRPPIPESDRSIVRQLIGEKAERLVWLYCCLRRNDFEIAAARGTPNHIVNHATGERVTIVPHEALTLTNLLAADVLEQLARCPLRNRRRAESVFKLRRHLLRGAYSELRKVRNTAFAWRVFAVIAALGSTLLPWFGIPPDLGFGPLEKTQVAFACGIFLSSAVVATAQPHRARQWFWLFGFAPSGLLLLGILFLGRGDFWPLAIASALGLVSAGLGVYVGRNIALLLARNAR